MSDVETSDVAVGNRVYVSPCELVPIQGVVPPIWPGRTLDLNNHDRPPTGTLMSGIEEIQSRIQAIRSRITLPPASGQFDAVLTAQVAAGAPSTPKGAVAPGAGQESFVVAPVSQAHVARAQQVTAGVTLGVMLGLTNAPTTRPPVAGVMSAPDLEHYLQTHEIRGRNGLLTPDELTEVSGGWHGTARLLPPAAAAWEAMRATAATDGVELLAIDTYRSWEVQDRAHQAHLRGDKPANVLPAGTSEHGNGLAVDITNGDLVGAGDPEHRWLVANGAQFGWYPISNESWHWEFRGV